MNAIEKYFFSAKIVSERLDKMKTLPNGEIIFEDIGLNIPEILLPAGDDRNFWESWACVACDQYTSQPDYWRRVAHAVQGKMSAFHLMLPEIYLEESDVDARIEKINSTMSEYMENGVLRKQTPSVILVERDTKASPVRRGVVMALDLEAYDFNKGSGSLVRATEGTVVERIPPRMKIRKNAVLEMPHVMILIDDPERTVVEPLFEADSQMAYDFELMEKGGHIKGRRLTDLSAIKKAAEALRMLGNKKHFTQKYGVPENTPVLLYAVGDGNHSLASAKCHWEELKKQGADPAHPARYALVEVVNIHDEGIVFEPIHRVLFHVNPAHFFDELQGYFTDKASYMENIVDMDAAEYPGCHTVKYVGLGCKGNVFIDKQVHTLAVGALQEFIDYYLKGHPESRVDYIHGDDVVAELGSQPGNIGFYLPAIDKNDFFKTVICNGSLPRKTFSMGEAFEKRYYIECRKII